MNSITNAVVIKQLRYSQMVVLPNLSFELVVTLQQDVVLILSEQILHGRFNSVLSSFTITDINSELFRGRVTSCKIDIFSTYWSLIREHCDLCSSVCIILKWRWLFCHKIVKKFKTITVEFLLDGSVVLCLLRNFESFVFHEYMWKFLINFKLELIT